MPDSFLHGVEVIEDNSGVRPIQTATSSIIGLVGSAPIGPVNTPVIIHGSLREGVAQFGPAGYGFSIPDALDAIMDQYGALVVVVNVADPTDDGTEVPVVAAPMTFDVTGKIQLAQPAVSLVTVSGPVTAPMTFTGTALALPTGATLPVVKSADGNTTYTLTDDYTYANHTITQVSGGAMASGQTALITYTITGIASPADFTVDGVTGIISLVGGKLVPKATVSVGYTYLQGGNRTEVEPTPAAFSAAGAIQLPQIAVDEVEVSGPVTAPMSFTGTALALPAGASAPVVGTLDGSITYQLTTDYTFADGTITQAGGGSMVPNQSVLVQYTSSAFASPADFTVDEPNGIIYRVVGGRIPPRASLTVQYKYLDPAKISNTAVIGGVDPVSGDYSGVHVLVGAESRVGIRPRILIAPGYTSQKAGSTANAVVAELQGIAEKLRAVIVADGPSTTDDAAVAYRNDWGSPRVYMIDPRVLVENPVTGVIEPQPSSARVAGLICMMDNTVGFWASPSNQEIGGIVGTERPIDFAMGDYSSRANVLNSEQIATIINIQGYRLWGNRTCSSDQQWAFLSWRRTADIIEDSLMAAHLWAVDRNITKTYMSDVTDGVNAFLAHLKAEGAIVDGRCWADPELNTPTELANGHVYFDFDFCPPGVAEHITFTAHVNINYLTEVLSNSTPTVTAA